MRDDYESRTRSSLLRRLRDDQDHEAWNQAWNELVERYSPIIYGWCRAGGLQEADACDVTQATLARLVKSMRSFEYDRAKGRFRGWLKRVWNSALSDEFETREAAGGTADGSVKGQLEALEAREDLWKRLSHEFDLEAFDEAVCRVRAQVQDTSWRAFELGTLGRRPHKEVAAELGISVAAATQACYRVMAMLRKELVELERDSEEPP